MPVGGGLPPGGGFPPPAGGFAPLPPPAFAPVESVTLMELFAGLVSVPLNFTIPVLLEAAVAFVTATVIVALCPAPNETMLQVMRPPGIRVNRGVLQVTPLLAVADRNLTANGNGLLKTTLLAACVPLFVITPDNEPPVGVSL